MKKIYQDIDRKFEKVFYINIQNFSINGCALYQSKKCFFKITDEDFFIKEINGYLISYKEIPTMNILFVKYLHHCQKYLIAYKFNNIIKKNYGLLNDVFVNNDLKKRLDNSTNDKLKNILVVYNDIYHSHKCLKTYCPSDMFFFDRVDSRLNKWYAGFSKLKTKILLNEDEEFDFEEILKETAKYFKDNESKKRQCVLTQGDPNTLNISIDPCFFDLATAGYNSIIGEVSITIISTMIYDNYFCPKYHSASYYMHEKAIEQFHLFEPDLHYKYDEEKKLHISSNILTSNIRKQYILNYLNILKSNNIYISPNIKYYIIMRLLCVFDIRKMDKRDYYYSLYLVCYFYKNINSSFYDSIFKIINEMECI